MKKNIKIALAATVFTILAFDVSLAVFWILDNVKPEWLSLVLMVGVSLFVSLLAMWTLVTLADQINSNQPASDPHPEHTMD